MSDKRAAAVAWYREPWVWILMAGPVAVVLGGALTAWIAYSTADGLVAEDYYRQGLGINRVLRREANASRLGVTAKIEFADEFRRVRVLLSGGQPSELRMRFARATRAGYELHVRLAKAGDGSYKAALPKALPAGRWQVQIEDSDGDWRLSGAWSGEAVVALEAGKKG